MKISAITNNFLPQRIQNNFSTPVPTKVNQQGDIYVSFKRKHQEQLVDKRKFDISDYKVLSPFEKRLILNRCNDKDQKRADTNIELALDIKDELDGMYGEGKYVFECIGTSPAPIARVLEFMGVETHYFPISNLADYDLNMAKKQIEADSVGQKKYSEFLSSQGVKPDMLDNDDRTFVFYDFTQTGTSLGHVRDLLEECYDVPVSYKVRYRSLNNDLHMLYDDTLLFSEKKCCSILEDFPRLNAVSDKCRTVLDYIRVNLLERDASNYCGIPHLPLENIRNIGFVETSPSLRFEEQKYNFLVIDKLNEMGLLKENPANKVSL